MYTARLVESEEWQSHAPRFIDYNYCQFYGYAQSAARRRSAHGEFVLIKDGAEVVGAAAVRVLKFGPPPFAVAYVRGGPICHREGRNYGEAFRACVQTLVAHYAKDARMILKIVPPFRPGLDAMVQAEVLKEFGFQATIGERPHRTILKPVRRGDEQLEASLDRKWRRNLKMSLRSPLTPVSGTSDALFEQFEDLYAALRQHKKFSVDQDSTFFRSVQESLAPADRFTVHLALHDDKPVAGYVGTHAGDTGVYLFGASNHEGRHLRAGYWLQWHVMRYFRDHGIGIYDLGGIDPVANPDVYNFKMGMSGDEVTANGPVEVVHGVVGRAFSAALSLVRRGLIAVKQR